MEEKVKVQKRFVSTMTKFIKWSVIGIGTGIFVGCFASIFAKCLQLATAFREAHEYTFLTLPIGGIIIVTIYKLSNMENDGGTDNVIRSIEQDVIIPFRQSILIFLSTVITIFCGGSVGREGAALQMGASLGNSVSRMLKLDTNDRKILIMSGMSAAFGALFSTPMAAAFFAMEVSSIGIMHYAAIVPCILSSLTSYKVMLFLGITGEHFPVGEAYALTANYSFRILLLASLCALLSVIFCIVMQYVENVLHNNTKNKYIRIIIGSFILIGLNLMIGTDDYQGTGMKVIEQALEGNANTFAFLLKLIFTVITISAGFKGGEIVPSFFMGATFGCVVSGLLGLPVTLGASVAMIAVFCGVTNCPVASLLLAIEIFGTGNLYYFLIAIAVSYMLSGYYSLYHTQIIVFSKDAEEKIHRKIGHIFESKKHA